MQAFLCRDCIWKTRKTRKTYTIYPENPKNPKNLRSMPGKPEESRVLRVFWVLRVLRVLRVFRIVFWVFRVFPNQEGVMTIDPISKSWFTKSEIFVPHQITIGSNERDLLFYCQSFFIRSRNGSYSRILIYIMIFFFHLQPSPCPLHLRYLLSVFSK